MAAVAIYSCSKEKPINPANVYVQKTNTQSILPKSNERSTVIDASQLPKEFRMNNVPVTANDVNLMDSSLTLVINLEETKMTYNCFSSEANCMSWLAITPGGDKVIDAWNKAKQLRHIADSLGALAGGIDKLENNGLLMAQFVLSQSDLFPGVPPATTGPNPVVQGIGAWYKGYDGTGSSFPTITKPFFPSSWNNTISSVGYFGTATLYFNNSFFGNHLLTIIHAPFNFFLSFSGMNVDNKTSSAIVF